MFSRSVASAVEANKTINIKRISLPKRQKNFRIHFSMLERPVRGRLFANLTKSVLYRSYN